MRKSVSAVDLEWLFNRADTLLLAHLNQEFPIPTTMLAAGMTKKAEAALQQRYPKANFSTTNLTLTTPVASHSIDLLVANLVAEHEMDLTKLFSEVERVLTEEGLVLFTTNDSRTKTVLGKYARVITDDLVDENSTTEKMEKIDVMRFFFRRYHVLLIEQAHQFIDCDVFIASAAYPPQLLKKLLEYPIRIDEVILQEAPVLTEKEAAHTEEKEQAHEQEEASEDGEEQEIEEIQEKVEDPESVEETAEKAEEIEETDIEKTEAEEIPEAVEEKEIEPHEIESGEHDSPEAEEGKEQDVAESFEQSEDKIATESEAKTEIEADHESDEPEKAEPLEPEESDEAEDEEVPEEEEPEELEESEERKIETDDEQPEPAKKENLESSEYRELHTLWGLLNENEKVLQAHEAVMTKELHNTVRVLSKSQMMHYSVDTKQKQTKQLEQHKQLLNNYRSLTDKHKGLVGDFMQRHAQLLEHLADAKTFQPFINRQTNVVKRHTANIEQHEAFLNTKK